MENYYIQIDQAIQNWATRNQLVLHTNSADLSAPEFRCVYASSQLGECCQIWIEPPADNIVHIHAEDVESRSDENMRYDWQTSVQDLPNALDSALNIVREWFNRYNDVPPA